MSVATELRSFLLTHASITQISQNYIPEEYTGSTGFIYFARRSTAHARSFEQSVGDPDSSFYDIEIYHKDPDTVEADADALQALDSYNGTFGSGRVQGVFLETQSDDYVPRVPFTDEEIFFSAFLSIEVRAFTE